MTNRKPEARTLWLIAGVVAGLCLSFVWPHEPMAAATAARAEKFAMVTVPVGQAAIPGANNEAVFVLDMLTGQLRGAVINDQNGKFTHAYQRNIAQDFKVDPTRPEAVEFVLVSGAASLPSRGQAQMANGVIYVGELSSGRVNAYGFSYAQANRAIPPMPLVPLDSFQFREALAR